MSLKREKAFAYFIKKFGEPTLTEEVSERSLLKYKGILPEQLLQYWKMEGWSAYANGLFWIVNPEKYEGLVELWLEDTHYPKIDKYHCIARTAFGVLYVWGERNNQWFTISCPTNTIVAFDNKLVKNDPNPNDAIRVFFAGSNIEGYDLQGLNKKDLFKPSLDKLDHLKSNEVYSFAPALVAGGSPIISNIEKEDLFIHLSILREIAPPSLPYSDIDIDALMQE